MTNQRMPQVFLRCSREAHALTLHAGAHPARSQPPPRAQPAAAAAAAAAERAVADALELLTTTMPPLSIAGMLSTGDTTAHPAETILLLGEGDFSFARGATHQPGTAPRLRYHGAHARARAHLCCPMIEIVAETAFAFLMCTSAPAGLAGGGSQLSPSFCLRAAATLNVVCWGLMRHSLPVPLGANRRAWSRRRWIPPMSSARGTATPQPETSRRSRR